MQSFQKTRIAPTPSGFLHLGNAFSFILTAAMARLHGASILLRVDDLDKERCRQAYLDDLFDTLLFLDIPWDEGPRSSKEVYDRFSQHLRLDQYETVLSQLHQAGFLFPCACSRSDLANAGLNSGCTGKCLEKTAQAAAWKIADSPETIEILSYPSRFSTYPFPTAMKHLVVKKKDGFPSYHLASVVDDVFFGVDLIVRGADLWESSLAQLHLSSLLPTTRAFAHATFLHHTLLTEDGQKLSKSAGHNPIRQLRQTALHRKEVYQQASRFFGLEAEAANLREFTDLLDPMRFASL